MIKYQCNLCHEDCDPPDKVPSCQLTGEFIHILREGQPEFGSVKTSIVSNLNLANQATLHLCTECFLTLTIKNLGQILRRFEEAIATKDCKIDTEVTQRA